MVNEIYVSWLVNWIKTGTINIKTGLPFAVEDIIDEAYKTEIENRLAAE